MILRLLAIAVAFSVTLISCGSNVGIKVKGHTDATSKEVQVYDYETQRMLTKLPVNNGTFEYSNENQLNKALLFYDASTNKHTIVINDAHDVVVNISADSVSGSALTSQYSAIKKQIAAYRREASECRRQSTLESDETKALSLRAKARQAKARAMLELYEAIEKNEDNLISVMLIMDNVMDIEFSRLKQYVRGNYAFSKNNLLGMLNDYIQAGEAANSFVGKKFIDFTENDVAGKAHQMSEYVGKGKYVLIDFWASWCGPCMKEMPTLKKAKQRYAKLGFDIVGISLDQDRTKWKDAIAEAGLDWIHLSNLNGFYSQSAQMYKIQSIPSNFLCDGDGVIVAVNLRGAALLEKLEEVYETVMR